MLRAVPLPRSLGSSGQWGNGSLSGGSYGDGPAGHQGQGSGTSEDRISRLAYGDVQKSAALRDALAQHHYGQFTFAPAINERSRRIGRVGCRAGAVVDREGTNYQLMGLVRIGDG